MGGCGGNDWIELIKLLGFIKPENSPMIPSLLDNLLRRHQFKLILGILAGVQSYTEFLKFYWNPSCILYLATVGWDPPFK